MLDIGKISPFLQILTKKNKRKMEQLFFKKNSGLKE